MGGDNQMIQCYETPTKEVSERMRKVKSSGTSIENEMKKIMNSLNIEFEEQTKLLGKPDFRIIGTNILIFCDSSFWHGRREREVNGTAFKRNKEFWTNKLLENKKRDQRNNRRLRKEGWSVHRFWDTDIIKNQEKVIKRLKRLLDGVDK